jgi:hypothetical protein
MPLQPGDEAELYASSDEYYLSWWEEYHEKMQQEHDSDGELMFFCVSCERWHNTSAGDRLDELYADIFPQSAYTYYEPGYCYF